MHAQQARRMTRWEIRLGIANAAAVLLVGCCGQPPDINKTGGAILVYEVDVELMADADGTANLASLCNAVQRRLSAKAGRGLIVQPHGEQSIEIILPGISDQDLAAVKRAMSRQGKLEFLIVANEYDHGELIEHAFDDPGADVTLDGERVGKWVNVRTLQHGRGEPLEFAAVTPSDVLRGRDDDDVVRRMELDGEAIAWMMNDERTLAEVAEKLGFRDVQVLLVTDPKANRNVTGEHLFTASSGYDNLGSPAIHFSLTREGAVLLGRVTSRNMPNEGANIYRRLGIILDGELISAPRLLGPISDNGQITGDFTQREVDGIVDVLRAGRLPAILKPIPISEQIIEPP